MTAGQDSKTTKRGLGTKLLRVFLVALAGIAVAAGLLIAVPPSGLIKDQIERAASTASGRTVTIGGADIKLLPSPAIRLSDVVIANPEGMAGPQLLQAKSIDARLKLKPLFSGTAEIESLEFSGPQINLIKDAAGKTNWAFDQKTQTTVGPAVTLLNGATIKDGLVSYTSAATKEPVRYEHVDATVEANGQASAKGTLAHHGESAALDIAISDILAAQAGKPTDLKITVDGSHLKGQINGTASGADPQDLSGDVALTSGSVRDLARWLGSDVAQGGTPVPGSATGKFKATSSSVTFEGTDLSLGSDTGKLTGKLSLTGERPKYEGSIALKRINFDSMFGAATAPVKAAGPEAETDLELETAPAWDGLLTTLQGLGASPEAAAAPASAAAKPSAAAWSEAPIDLTILQSADLDAVITSDELVLGKLDLKNAQINTKLTGGKLDATLEKLTVGAGSATGKLALDSGKAVPRADMTISLVNVAAEPIITEITGKPLLAGTSNVEINARGQGKSQNELAASIEGKASFRMSKGVIRGFDIRSIVSNWWNSLTGGLKFDLNKKTGFEKLDALYDIKKGVMTSSPGLDIGGNEVEVQSRGNVSLPAKLITQEIRVKVVPPPSAPPIPVKITGPWSKPSISMDWGDLLFSSRVAEGPDVGASAEDDAARGAAPVASAAESIAGGFQDLAPKPEEIPDGVKNKIKSVLASDQAAAITPQGRALLETLLNAPAGSPVSEPTTAPAEPESPAAP